MKGNIWNKPINNVWWFIKIEISSAYVSTTRLDKIMYEPPKKEHAWPIGGTVSKKVFYDLKFLFRKYEFSDIIIILTWSKYNVYVKKFYTLR